MKKLSLIIFLGLTLMLGLYFYLQPKPAPSVSFKLTNGNTLELAQLKGQPVLINFWATTCASCREEMPNLYRLHQEFDAKGLKIIGVAIYYDPPNEVIKFIDNHNIPYPVALDIDKTLSKSFSNIQITPTTILISPDGMVVEQITGRLSFDNLRKQIKSMLATKLTS